MKFTKNREEETAHKACALYTMYAVVVVVMRRRGLTGRRMEVEGWGDGIIDMKSMQIHCPHENARAAFSDFSTRKLGFRHCIYRIHVDNRPKRYKTFTFTHKSVSMWMAPEGFNPLVYVNTGHVVSS